MDEASAHFYVVLAILALSVPTFLWLLRTTAPYGRHNREGWGRTIPARTGWLLMETPTVVLFIGIYALGEDRFEPVPLILLLFWQLHYFHRTYVFPFRMRTEGKRMPISIPLMGMTFTTLNTYVNARSISHFGEYPIEWLRDPRFWIGGAIFLFGWIVNLHADTVLIHLRKPGETGYKIPRGGLYRWISSPNYFGEIIEWSGWALMTWSLAGTAFAVYSIANLAPRAIANHNWYKEKFADYPRERRALLPFLF
jgi:protein-S-isoprenylcysteine O-methyltransferase Ste14